ncbi:hypothetical protein, partial [Yersinia pseudotuberculosis]|uniref:hypothetical protein n=1 Tax=Yersinia pseudotuberculosis TaxID=633 RepID=UPI001E3B8B4F
VFITDPKLKALLNPQPSWGFSGHKKAHPSQWRSAPQVDKRGSRSQMDMSLNDDDYHGVESGCNYAVK